MQEVTNGTNADLTHRLTVSGLSKRYGGVQALDDARLDVLPGEVHGLVGENGAGKSTLLGVLAGEVHPDAGRVRIGDMEVVSLNRATSRANGLAIVHQEIVNAPRFSVAESIALGAGYPIHGGIVRWGELHRWSQRLLDEWELVVNSKTQMGLLTPAQQVIIAIIAALATKPRIVVLDEPTASFSPPEADHLLGVVRKLSAEGVSVIYVSHRLAEVLDVCDRVTVMREGKTISTEDRDGLTRDRLVELIVGRRIERPVPLAGVKVDAPLRLEVKDVAGGRVSPASFEARQGEILGFAGLVGAGRTELFDLIYGSARRSGGSIRIDGQKVNPTSPSRAVDAGMGLVPEERRGSGIIPEMSVRENVVLSVLQAYASSFGLQNVRRQRADVLEVSDRISLASKTLERPIRTLSGGNQQKAVVARWILANPKVLIFDEPSRGVDIGAKEEIFDLIRQVAERGVTVLVASSEVEELVGLCHRVLVMREGRIVSELTGEDIDVTAILNACFAD